jgi:DNA helicase-2/ATP-dependent DNA helicase PcrA
MASFKPSKYQLNVYNFIKNNTGSAIIQAVAGSGKTTTIVSALSKIPSNKKVLLLAFNKSIADELKQRVPNNVRVMTYHSCAFSAYRFSQKNVVVNKDKLNLLIRDIIPDTDFQYVPLTKRLVSLAKAHAIGYLTSNENSEWMNLIEKFSLLNQKLDSDFSVIDLIHYSKLVYSENNKLKCIIDFDDMILFPLIYKSNFFKQDFIFVDEAQDTSSVQRNLLKRMMNKNTRVIAVGDSAQAIYGFRGADSNSMSEIQTEFGAKELPLSICYRCSSEVVREAQEWNNKILPSPDAPVGSVVNLNSYEPSDFKNTDAIVCRNTAPLINMAFALISRDVPVNVLGRDIGKGLVSYIRSLKCKKISKLKKEMEEDYLEKIKDLDKDDSKLHSLTDQKNVINIFINNNIDNRVDTLCSFIENFFGDSQDDNITLCTIHKSKGHEWERVFILDRDLLMPSWVTQDWAVQQEKNIAYVAITRAKKDLMYISSNQWK